MCYKIKPYPYFPHSTDEVSYYTLAFQIKVTKLTNAENIPKMVIWVTDEQSWDGIIFNQWHLIKPLR